jgi:hypothetical protein
MIWGINPWQKEGVITYLPSSDQHNELLARCRIVEARCEWIRSPLSRSAYKNKTIGNLNIGLDVKLEG